ncbi:MAG TPA: methyltransferase domain-containing protein [Candidatus Dormibacteraeota bacterium]|nr:methyltransferase domain-containing protein [Candidatus Dormibacteraeota bacterium]
MATILACPVCGEGLDRIGPAYRCSTGHGFDLAKEGYVNLLLSHQRRSAEPGDSPEMIRHRRAFLEAGFYEPLAHHVNQKVSYCLRQLSGGAHHILDAGCGEGYFLRCLRSHLIDHSVALYGIDISRTAIRYAAKASPDITFAVASVHRLPILAATVDVVISILAPRDYKEWWRITTPHGRLLVVVPGPYHLFGLRSIVYRQPLPHETQTKLDARPWFQFLDETSIEYTLRLSRPDIDRLVYMTPYLWHLDDESRAVLKSINELETSVEFVVTHMERVT